MKSKLYVVLCLLVFSNCKKISERPPTKIPRGNYITLSTETITDIKGTEATTGARFSYYGDSNIIDKGICWSLTPNPDTLSFRQSKGKGIGNFNYIITNLQPKNTYYTRAYAINKKGIYYGNELTFTTLDVLSVSTDTILNITRTTAQFKGTILSYGNKPIFEYGFCYSDLYSMPDIYDEKLAISSGNPFGAFLQTLKKGTTYAVRAYARNADGLVYGKSIQFKTKYNKYEIGDSAEGGFVFYVDATGDHGLIAANKDIASAKWGCQGTSISGTYSYVGSGATNTTRIIQSCFTTGIAARICDASTLNGYSDWFLPSKDELNLMHQNLYLKNKGNFKTNVYWSSTQSSSLNAWRQLFNLNLNQAYYDKDLIAYLVRPARPF